MAIEFLLKSPLNIAGYLLSIYYIEIWKASDIISGLLFSLSFCEIFLIFIIGGLIDYLEVKHSYILASILGLFVFAMLVLVENFILHVVLIVVGLATIAMITYTSLRKAIVLSTDFTNRPQGFSMFNAMLYISIIIFGIFYEVIIALQGVTMDAFKSFFYLFIGFYILAIIMSSLFSKLTREWSDDNKIYVKGPIEIMREVSNEKRF
jgi:MFS family permease